MRGGKNIDTRTRFAKNGVVKFSEKFMMKTSLEYDHDLEKYVAKPVSCYPFVIGFAHRVSFGLEFLVNHVWKQRLGQNCGDGL